MKPQGLLLVLSGPSGAGKGTICQMLREKLPELAYSVSVTTMPGAPMVRLTASITFSNQWKK